MGTSQFAVPSLKALLQEASRGQNLEVSAVVTQPDRPAGRGRKLTPTPVKWVADSEGIPAFQPHGLSDNPAALRFLCQICPDLIILVAFGQILPLEFFEYPSLGSLNVHASLLPKYRGAAPVVHVLLHGETQTGVTIMKIDAGLDTGAILSQAETVVDEDVAAGELEEQLAQRGAELLIQTLPLYISRKIPPQPQDHARASYAPAIKKSETRIDWTQSAPEIHNRIRAFNPRPTAFAGFRRREVKIWRSRKVGLEVSPHSSGSGRPGEVMGLTRKGILVRCGQHSLLHLTELQFPNRKRLLAPDFANGAQVTVGERFV